jgi:hypothetical protein
MTDEYQISHCVKRLLAIELEMGDVDMTLRRLVAARHRADAIEAANDVGGERGPDTQGPATSGQQAQADERGADSRGPDSGGPTTGGDAQR